jgi:hypothetical protein
VDVQEGRGVYLWHSLKRTGCWHAGNVGEKETRHEKHVAFRCHGQGLTAEVLQRKEQLSMEVFQRQAFKKKE